MRPELGLIEGFFGRPWGWRARSEAVRFLAPHGYRFFLYAPKADPFLRRRWQEIHPDGELEEIARFGILCRELGISFGIGLSPFELHLQPGRSWQEPLAAKLASLNALPIDDLALLFDDMRGDIPEIAERQSAIVHFAAERSLAKRIIFCPTYYSHDPVLDVAFGQRPPLYLETLGKQLDPSIEIMWTGEEVCSVEYSPGHLAEVSERLRRRPFLWDNYPVNDGPRMARHLHLRAFTGRPAAIGPHLSAHGINLASQPVLSRIPALTLAASYRDGDLYAYGAAFDAAAEAVVGPELARMLRRDLIALQDRGLDRLGDRRAALREHYAGWDHPGAAEILAWLDGAYEPDEDVLTQ
ncbi:beta-N-acetylglucosaminidase domain-containing protein [Sphingosinicella rhizophila]|uniref:Beta-N-acetylglucosaminidase domain-containing protein n=1 Tax=Sphingosinicella rhizophila TaxID=3050082 RepID=A0ABU3Q7Z3_9SPHN|nr:beta-N-acetylglucosaminidase domain-containing protein [Sphingosinicella sp. GR2756]MDT9599529.1 beta-N-acetylglucosaminidase domain-containing protein [Sphingosinicella sp. GR2756]